LVYGKIEGVPVFVLYGTNYINEGRPSGDLTCGVHVKQPFLTPFSLFSQLLHALNVEKVLFVTPVVAVGPEVKIGDLAIIRDHVSLSGRSSIFGHNEER
jgi:hypothetical protein